MIVHLIDGTYELFRHFYGLRRFTKGKDRPYGMGRKDWFNIAIGTLINLAIAIALPPDVTRQAFEILRDALG